MPDFLSNFQTVAPSYEHGTLQASSQLEKGYMSLLRTAAYEKCHDVDDFVCLFAWGLTALSAQIGYIAP